MINDFTHFMLFAIWIIVICMYINTIEIDKVLYKFCKHVLGVPLSTPNVAVLGELGQLPLSEICKFRVLKYWCHIISNKSTLLYKVYSSERQQLEVNVNTKCWCHKVKSLLDSLGFSDIWLNENSVGIPFDSIKQRITDQYLQSWSEKVNGMNRLELYKNIKTELKFENYLDEIANVKQRKALTKFRCSAHNLAIETGRHNNIPRNERVCKLCNNNNIENEYHFTLICPALRENRLKYIPKSVTSFPNLTKLYNFCKSANKQLLSKFILTSLEKRNEVLNQ
eukprot:GHVU01120244.1.p1 GENE.GHVU01120244.1~~GHVU01120244.1.p1  ORF type:complete len:281 (-),score=3.44 GHVU01120244.1:191-1033(-)